MLARSAHRFAAVSDPLVGPSVLAGAFWRYVVVEVLLFLSLMVDAKEMQRDVSRTHTRACQHRAHRKPPPEKATLLCET